MKNVKNTKNANHPMKSGVHSKPRQMKNVKNMVSCGLQAILTTLVAAAASALQALLHWEGRKAQAVSHVLHVFHASRGVHARESRPPHAGPSRHLPMRVIRAAHFR
jgi:hypothetical protein